MNTWLPHALTALVLLAIFPLAVGYLVLLERKVLADLQERLGPMRVGPHGLLQPIADALKLLLKEDVRPARADQPLFVAAPLISFVTALLGFVVLPFSAGIFIADLNVGVLLISATSALGILGIILGGWSSNSHYPLLGALRSAAQLVSYEVALGLGLLAGVMVAGNLSLNAIVNYQLHSHRWILFSNYGAMIVPFVVFLIAAIAETNRIPFDLPEAESELVAGYHTEFSGFRWALYMLAEWGNILVVCAVAVTLFLGGWLRPFASIGFLQFPLDALVPFFTFASIAGYCVYRARFMYYRYELSMLLASAAGLLLAGSVFLIPAIREPLAGLYWFFLKLGVLVYLFIWMRGTLPRVRYDQLMSFGWKYLIPVGIGAIGLNAVLGLI
ncbi:MAG: respiratory-chain dehydrogenase, subunit 1 [Bryobacterales bacterium]|jgi:NADH-quinone oxidoreductase subunit H|nr:respiratory-chain dehydrogenase, subunit 1 [Bryobacterales bacterium]